MKLVYVLPEYQKDAHTHFSYIPDFLSRVATSLDVTLLVERGTLPQITGVKSERASLFAIVKARMHGIRACYVHYSFRSAFIAALVFGLTGGKVFYWNCGLPWEYRRSWWRDLFERTVYKMVSYVVTGTDGLADAYAKEYKIPRSKILVMPNWIDIEKTKDIASAPSSGRYVLFAHRLSPRKGAQYLPDIARNLPKGIELIVAGDGPLRQGLTAENIRTLGWQPHEKIVSLMAYASAFITPSDEEGFPHVLLEAMALGVPFVATDVGGVSEMVPPTLKASLVQKGDMSSFSARLAHLLSIDGGEREKIKAAMAEWVLQYDTAVVARRFSEIVHTV